MAGKESPDERLEFRIVGRPSNPPEPVGDADDLLGKLRKLSERSKRERLGQEEQILLAVLERIYKPYLDVLEERNKYDLPPLDSKEGHRQGTMPINWHMGLCYVPGMGMVILPIVLGICLELNGAVRYTTNIACLIAFITMSLVFVFIRFFTYAKCPKCGGRCWRRRIPGSPPQRVSVGATSYNAYYKCYICEHCMNREDDGFPI